MCVTNGNVGISVEYFICPKSLQLQVMIKKWMSSFHRPMGLNVKKVVDTFSNKMGVNAFDVKKMAQLLDHDNFNTRDRLRAFLKKDTFRPRYNISMEEEREIALNQLKLICSHDFLSINDFKSNPSNIFAVHEIAGMTNVSMATKLTVQFNLFGGTVLKLGSKKHHDEFTNKIDQLQAIGCFGLTELGYGNNAVEMETTAEYDEETKEFIVNTPTVLAQKYWITNSAGNFG